MLNTFTKGIVFMLKKKKTKKLKFIIKHKDK
ncbi:hypothetical protein SEEM030_04676 [Salmonella enterica subsp. enterica serovar Montevideo str. SARB30]|nr:hypothetical protein SEEM315_04465 [Salmonella enterica subsp. enterica serovar Montevideo str. 315996572]EFY18324.1 hypothetical protein SEEM971_08283 [Salmonella enterica subsp. enterica serovar Montevideo str. 495297-1]EFY21165.1 hypothetical protein SEEM973_03168 [Salmonella enterica subsp. enterica serovar Montevideo str. 495297-3]EFY26147.1 hypothetical protein SEEM974_01730 [Salmonella enterica subsp. enterica serovar Montevideo str. 495297-4]EFY30351.1 hypothetical protein SEEM201_14